MSKKSMTFKNLVGLASAFKFQNNNCINKLNLVYYKTENIICHSPRWNMKYLRILFVPMF